MWDDDHQYKFTYCNQGYEVDFGTIATNEAKAMRLNITNMNPAEIVIESI